MFFLVFLVHKTTTGIFSNILLSLNTMLDYFHSTWLMGIISILCINRNSARKVLKTMNILLFKEREIQIVSPSSVMSAVFLNNSWYLIFILNSSDLTKRDLNLLLIKKLHFI